MIKNVLFDIGKVIISWHPDKMALIICGGDKEKADVITKATYNGKYWQRLDEGTLGIDEAIELTVKDLGGEYRELITSAYKDFTKYVALIDDTYTLIKKLNKEGYNLYLASNFSEKVYDVVKRFSLNKFFKGHVFSYEEKVVKPSVEFFDIMLKRYSLDPGECVFIDDLTENVDGAKKTGIHGFVFKNNQKEAYEFIKSFK